VAAIVRERDPVVLKVANGWTILNVGRASTYCFAIS
jgi:hypothetical protein